jgi:hypothetical protein
VNAYDCIRKATGNLGNVWVRVEVIRYDGLTTEFVYALEDLVSRCEPNTRKERLVLCKGWGIGSLLENHSV